ncbi:hypothetical protein [Herbiconiux liangxiaofengii]|uniref:hypothetical protein n=1 Tax=Herbiconiux liangxiaofengii TaxID=3342795 RepID=UPI0035B80302
MKYRITAVVLATIAFLGIGSAAALGQVEHESDAPPVLAQTGYDFTPMLVTAAVFLLIAGVTVVVAKYFVVRSSH